MVCTTCSFQPLSCSFEVFRKEYPSEVLFCPKFCYRPSLMRRFYEFHSLQCISLQIHWKDETLYNWEVALYKDGEQENSNEAFLEPDSNFDDEINETSGEQMGFSISNLNEKDNSKHLKEVRNNSEKKIQEKKDFLRCSEVVLSNSTKQTNFLLQITIRKENPVMHYKNNTLLSIYRESISIISPSKRFKYLFHIKSQM